MVDDAPPLFRKPADFVAAYAGKAPWDIDRPQAAFVALADAGALVGRVLECVRQTREELDEELATLIPGQAQPDDPADRKQGAE